MAPPSTNNQEYYSILNVPPTATNDDIQKSYKALSRIFHPDRLRLSSSARESELAQDTFVLIKTAHDVLCDSVYRFVYDRYGLEGVRFLRQCQQQRAQPQHQQTMDPDDVELYDLLQRALLIQHDTATATRWLDAAMRRHERWLQQVRQQRQRGSAPQFSANLSFPSAYHPSRSSSGPDMDDLWALLTRGEGMELERADLEFSLRRSNLKPHRMARSSDSDNNSSNEDHDNDDYAEAPEDGPALQKPQRHVVTSILGSSTQWKGLGTANSDVSLGLEYRPHPTATSQYGIELSTSVTKPLPLRQLQPDNGTIVVRPMDVALSSSHEFATGTGTTVQIRGSTSDRSSWGVYMTSVRKISMANLLSAGGESSPHPPRTGMTSLVDMRASIMMGVRLADRTPILGLITLTSLPPPPQHREPTTTPDGNNNGTPTTVHSRLSTPELTLRAGYHAHPVQATVNYKEFFYPWLSMAASWSWNFAGHCSRIKIMFECDWCDWWHSDNDSTTVRMGLRHDVLSGWIWLWEWEESDWTLRIPISLSWTKNSVWLAQGAAGGEAILQGSMLHYSLGSVVASMICSHLVRLVSQPWIAGAVNADNDSSYRRPASKDATSSDHPGKQDHFWHGYDPEEAEARRQHDIFRSIMMQVALKKRAFEQKYRGLVIRSATLMTTTTDKQDDSVSNGSDMVSTSTIAPPKDLTDILQFWVIDGSLNLPPLDSLPTASQLGESYYFYSIGGRWAKFGDHCKRSEEKSLSRFIPPWQNRTWNHVTAALWGNKPDAVKLQASSSSSSVLVIRYQYGEFVYEVSIDAEDRALLPNPLALELGSCATVS